MGLSGCGRDCMEDVIRPAGGALLGPARSGTRPHNLMMGEIESDVTARMCMRQRSMSPHAGPAKLGFLAEGKRPRHTCI